MLEGRISWSGQRGGGVSPRGLVCRVAIRKADSRRGPLFFAGQLVRDRPEAGGPGRKVCSGICRRELWTAQEDGDSRGWSALKLQASGRQSAGRSGLAGPGRGNNG